MRAVHLTARDWAFYLEQLLDFDIGDVADGAAEQALCEEAGDWVTPLLCTINADAKLDYQAIFTMLILSRSSRASTERMGELDPTFLIMGRKENVLYRARDACDAIKNLGPLDVKKIDAH